MTSPAQLSDMLREAIRERAIPPGGLLVQEDLARRFKVSRNPVREALRTLAAEGLVTLAPGERAYVRNLSLDDLREIYDLRLTIEPTIVPLIINNASPKDIDVLRRLASEMQTIPSTSSDDLRLWLRLNFTFHQRLFNLVDRPHTALILTSLLGLTQPYSQQNVGLLGGRRAADDEHLGMVDAIGERDADKFTELVVSHMVAARDRVAAAMIDAPDKREPENMLIADKVG